MAFDRKTYMKVYNKKYKQLEVVKAKNKTIRQSNEYKVYRKKYQASDKYKNYLKKYRKKNKKYLDSQKKYRQTEQYKVTYKKNRKKYRHTDKYKAAQKRYRLSNKGKVAQKKYRLQSENYKAYEKKYRMKTLVKLSGYMRTKLKIYMNIKKLRKSNKTFEYLGCNPKELKTYIENKFRPGMTWDNWGINGWHIDHIIPLSLAKDEDQIKKLFHYTNLQPLWAKDNLSKSNKIISQEN
jgi:hypothetical protein